LTLIFALEGGDGIVLGADSRATFGDPRGLTAQNDSVLKSYQLSKYVGILTAGDANLATMLLSKWSSGPDDASGVTEVMGKFRQAAKSSLGDWFKGFAVQQVAGAQIPTRPALTFIVAGYDIPKGGKGAAVPRLYQINSMLDFAPAQAGFGFALDGVPQYALYLLNRLYRKDRPIAELEHLAAYAITETASQDGKVGGPVRLATITPGDGYKLLPDPEVEEIVKNNVTRSENLRKSFYGE